MAEIEDGIITFTDEEEAKEVKQTLCPGCMLYDCAGPDSKTKKATTYSSKSDDEIEVEAACLKEI